MKKIIVLFTLLSIILMLVACNYEKAGKEGDTKTDSQLSWSNCPIEITGGIDGSSYEEYINLTISNKTEDDIDAVKILIGFEHSSLYSNEYVNDYTEYRTAYYTINTIWENSKVSETIDGGFNNFSRAQIYPVCVYFKNGTVWGDSSATYEEIIEKSKLFEIKHYALPADASDPRDTQCDLCKGWFSSRDIVNGNAGDGWKKYCPECYKDVFMGLMLPETDIDIPDDFDFEEIWKNQILNSDWINMYELQQISEEDLLFGTMLSSYHNWSLGLGNLVYGFSKGGYVSQEIIFIYDMPEEFAKSENNEGVFSNIKVKIQEGEWYFNPQNLISIGLLNEDGTFNENFVPQNFDESKAKKEWANNWISAEQLKNIYGISTAWMGEYIWMGYTDYDTNTSYDYKVYGSPKNQFEKDKVYNCDYEGKTIRVKYVSNGNYNGDYNFNYKDLQSAGIIP